MALTASEKKAKLKRYGLSDLINQREHQSTQLKKLSWQLRVGGKIKIIRFGAQGMGHNYSPEARRSFKARHRRNIARGNLLQPGGQISILAGKGGSVKRPPKSQKHVKFTRRKTTKKDENEYTNND